MKYSVFRMLYDWNIFYFIILLHYFISEWCLDNHKILWHQEEQKIKLENNFLGNDGIPYILIGSKILECQFGIDRNLYQKKRHQERRKVWNCYFHEFINFWLIGCDRIQVWFTTRLYSFSPYVCLFSNYICYQ